MRNIAPLLLLALCACAASDPTRIKPQIEIFELYGPADLQYSRGQNTMDAEFGFRITNRSPEQITLKRIDLASAGTSGAYLIRREDRAFTADIPSESYGDIRMKARVFFQNRADGTPSSEPVTIRAVLYFDSATGPFREIVIKNLGQFRSP